MLLIGLGLRSMSVRPSALLEIKQICRHVTVKDCVEVAENVMSMESPREIERYLGEELRRRVPEAVARRHLWVQD
jgi:phosphotransferase system enzyme I (PtsI)